MKNVITQEKPRVINHKKHRLELEASKKVNVWRGLDIKTYKYILTNRYFPDIILVRNQLEFAVDLKKNLTSEKLSKLRKIIDNHAAAA